MNSYPKLLAACQLIAYDNKCPEPQILNLPGVLEEDLQCAETALSELDETDFENFCIGEEADALSMLSTGLAVANDILCEYYDTINR